MALGGFGHGAQFCHMCNSSYCMHTLNGAMAQQQMSRHDMERLYNQFSMSQQQSKVNMILAKTHEEKIPNKKLLLLRK